MRNLETLSAEKLLSILNPERLFTRSADQAKREYRRLARRWHPDLEHSIVSSRVFAHIAQLYKSACQKLREGSWSEPVEKIEEEVEGRKKLRAVGGTVKSIEYKVCRPFELGMMYVADQSVTFEVSEAFSDLFRNGCKQIRELKFQNESMAIEMSSYLPQILDSFRTSESFILTIRKTPDQLLLSDILAHFNGKMPLEHVAWILNVLLHISCYLQWSGTTHNGITADAVFISPLRHSGMLLGGWWYATPCNERLRALPNRQIPIVPPDVLMNKRADSRVDLESIKAIGRHLLGDASGARLELDPGIPPELINWLLLPSRGQANEDYREWKYEVLEACFGAPRFTKLPLDSNLLYKEK